jgi:hypothetical protein
VDPRQGLLVAGSAEPVKQPEHGLVMEHRPLVDRDPVVRL